MASIKECYDLLKYTPLDQAMIFQGTHGIGKSETLRDWHIDNGFCVIILFVGQMADAGDLIGLPDRIEIELNYGDKTIKQKFTEFCPPKWWPVNPLSKICIIFDEVNRGKPELMQCLMDMINSHKLNGLELPKETRIIGCINPIEEDDYQVEELDPAFLDRWNVYDFKPTVDEWVDWANKKSLHKLVIGFIIKHNDHLDPPISKERIPGKVYSSRRSWKKVSDFLNKNYDDIINNDIILKNYFLGVIGDRSAPAFSRYIKEVDKGLYVGKIITAWSDKVSNIIQSMNTQDIIFLNKEISLWFDKNSKTLEDTEVGKKYALNIQKYLNTIPPETMAEFFNLLGSAIKEKKKWPKMLMDHNKNLGDRFLKILNGEEQILIDW